MIKTLHKVGVEGTCFKIRKAIYDKPKDNTIVLKTTFFPLKSWPKGWKIISKMTQK